MSSRITRILLPFILVFWSGIFSAPTSACSIPVFTYALYRWPADAYNIIVFYKGSLAPEHQAIIDRLNKIADDEGVCANYTAHTVDLETELDGPIRELWGRQVDPTVPWMVVLYPRNMGGVEVAWSGPLQAATARTLVDSPLRQEISRRILDGQVAVWVLLESGDRVQDDRAAELLKSCSTNVAKEIEKGLAPPGFVPETQPNEQHEPEQPEQKIAFSVLRLSRTDSAEVMFVNMLLNSEPDLRSFPEPMAFPVFGRGRVLYTLVGKGINEDNIWEACAFLVGGCSCQIKMANPGIDLLMSVDWDAALFGAEEGAAQLSTLLADWPGLAEPADVNTAQPEAAEIAMEHRSLGALWRNSLLGIVSAIIVVALIAFILKKRQPLR